MTNVDEQSPQADLEEVCRLVSKASESPILIC